MKGTRILTALVLLLALAATLTAACTVNAAPAGRRPNSPAASGPMPTNGLTQANSAAAVDIQVKWGGVRSGSLSFSVAMDTHSVDLDQIDLGKQAVLRDDAGAEYRPTAWSAPLGGHHRSGTLTTPVPNSVKAGSARYVELVVRDVAGVKERVFKWELPPKT